MILAVFAASLLTAVNCCVPFSHPAAAPGCVLGASEVMEAAIYETTERIILHKKTRRPENGVAWSVKTNR